MSTTDGSNNGTGGGGALGPGAGSGPGGGVGGTTGVAAKITHVKTTTLDGSGLAGLTSGSSGALTSQGGSMGTILTSAGVQAMGAIKVGNSGTVGNLSGTLNTSQSNTSGATSIRAIGPGGQSTQVRVVMGNLVTSSMIKQMDTGGQGRTQITAFPAATARSVSNTSITVTRPATQTTYLPRASVTPAQMSNVTGMSAAGQRLVTPLRTTAAAGTTVGSVTGGATVTGITGNFVRGATVTRNTSSPATTVISPANSNTWMTANPSGQVQLIRAIPQSRQRIITGGISGTTVSATGTIAAVSGTIVTTTASGIQNNAGGIVTSQQQTSVGSQQSTIQAISSGGGAQQQQQTYVATVLPPRQHQATLVYSSNVAATSQPMSQPAQFNTTSMATTGPRFAVATPITSGAPGSGGVAPRQIRPIPLGKSFPGAKLNTTSISIRAPQLTPTLGSAVVSNNATVVSVASNSPRNTTVSGISTSAGNIISSTNLPTTRIIQLQQQPGSATTQQIIGSAGRLAANVMLQPIIVNTSATGKIGIRPPVTMATKVQQPSLTITQLGIGKLPSSSSASSVLTSGVGVVGSSSPSISTATITATNLTSNSAAGTQMDVSQSGGIAGGQLLTTQNIVTSAAMTASGGATVVPLAISTRGAAGSNIITGTMTPIKTANAITVGKVMTPAQLQEATNSANCIGNTNNTAGSVFIHHPQRPHSKGNTNISSNTSTTVNAVGGLSVSNASSILTSTGGGGGNVGTAATFLQPGSTIYYESIPASSVQVSTGVLSLTTTTVTSSTTMSQNHIANSAANLSISSLPFVSHGGGNSGNSNTATFTVVPSTVARTIGQLQIPVSAGTGGAQIQAVPVRFSQLPNAAANISTAVSAADNMTVSQNTAQLLQQQQQQQQLSCTTPNSSDGSQIIIPFQTSIKVAAGSGSMAAGTAAMVSNFLRKRDVEGSPIRAAKNLQPTLMSMSSGTGNAGTAASSACISNLLTNVSSAASSSLSGSNSAFTITSVASSNSTISVVAANNNSNALTAEIMAKKERSTNNNMTTSALMAAAVNHHQQQQQQQQQQQRPMRAESPASSDGSTTVSANSSPGIDQQIQDNMIINRISAAGPAASNVDSHFNPINEHIMATTPVSSRNLNASLEHHHNMQQMLSGGSAGAGSGMQQRLNGNAMDCPPRKKSRRSTNDSQVSSHSQASLSLPPPQATNNVQAAQNANAANNTNSNNNNSNQTILSNGNAAATPVVEVNGKENTKPVEFFLKRPKNCTLLSTYKQSWKPAYNHFQRYSDVKPREDRRPTIMDLANQTNVLGKINGWKIYHLKSQMEDLCENESLGYEKLSSMLKQMESNGVANEMERISDLLKGNMQRSKIIVDGVSEAQNQIMKIFEHKSHVSDIINRCASKRNYKKREKV